MERTGLPGLEISYRLDAYTHGGLAGARRMHEEMFQRLGVTSFWHKDSAEAAGHIMGTARMGEDPRRSVVDKDLRAHDHRNLILIGAVVFPTGGTANPTLTVAALAIRAAHAVLAAIAESATSP